jgi:hypothetical protein
VANVAPGLACTRSCQCQQIAGKLPFTCLPICGRSTDCPNPIPPSLAPFVRYTCRSPSSPLLVDLGGAGIRLSAQAEGVLFDLRADGVPMRASWPRDPRSAMFLALDRNGDGAIDSGRELFGDATQLARGTADNGFEALAQYDANADGVIDAKDPVFAALSLWSDLDRDGRVGPRELAGLEDRGVRAIHLDYRPSGRVDSFGNAYREVASVVLSNGETRDIVDVWLAEPDGQAR